MRFPALLKKELRECLPWLVAAAAFLLIFGSLELRNRMLRNMNEYSYHIFGRYSEVSSYQLWKHPLGDAGFLVFVTAIGLGLALGFRQFWVADFTGTWGFTLHRSTHRTTILAAKIFAGFISMIVTIGLVWSYLSWRANLPDYSLIPLPKRFFIIYGLLAGAMGLLFYLGAGLVGLSKARWYTTKLAGLGFVLWMLVTFTQQITFWWCFGTLLIGMSVLLYLMWETFLKREF
jgi:hypothetical protein